MFNSPELISRVFRLKNHSTNRINEPIREPASKWKLHLSKCHSLQPIIGIQTCVEQYWANIHWFYRDIFIWNIAFRVNTDTADKMDEKSSYSIWDFFSIWLFLVCLYISLLRKENYVTCKRPGYLDKDLSLCTVLSKTE